MLLCGTFCILRTAIRFTLSVLACSAFLFCDCILTTYIAMRVHVNHIFLCVVSKPVMVFTPYEFVKYESSYDGFEI